MSDMRWNSVDTRVFTCKLLCSLQETVSLAGLGCETRTFSDILLSHVVRRVLLLKHSTLDSFKGHNTRQSLPVALVFGPDGKSTSSIVPEYGRLHSDYQFSVVRSTLVVLSYIILTASIFVTRTKMRLCVCVVCSFSIIGLYNILNV